MFRILCPVLSWIRYALDMCPVAVKLTQNNRKIFRWNAALEGALSAGKSQADTSVDFVSQNRGDGSVSSFHFDQDNSRQPVDPAREAQLANVVARTIIPKLLSQNSRIVATATAVLHPDQGNIDRLSALIIGPDNTDALEYIYALRDQGISLDDLHLELLEPTARHLGELWNDDKIDFFAVTMGVNRLQRIVHHFADLDKIEPYDEKRRALIVSAPGEDHNFGNQLVQKFLKAAGWSVLAQIGSDRQKIVDLVSQEWLAIIGFSISASAHVQSLTEIVRTIRARSLNPHIGIMIGGPIVVQCPELVDEIGADGTADNAASAVILAKKLLASGLQAESGLKKDAE